ncbi:Protein of unknown function [Curtobacterium sp. 314Chir4.1]|uniref:DUF4041 domain-containing protein n=1 Tax=Curtobacterium sp. 314Chir4.1 TaxID=1279028 RepID=UPI000BC99E56|nr:DUF4041 domain-containing protein [Curtobacterium sp. 314Chir4.1]SOC89820.1 Protein of unknown function [Curtobacterium sp. 314Chir4.1]
MSTAPGWYDDPQDPTIVRYFDGLGWTPHTQYKPNGSVPARPATRLAQKRDVPLRSRRELRAQQAGAEPAVPGAASQKRERLSKNEARARLAAAEETIARHGLRRFEEIDSYRESVEAELAAERQAALEESASLRKEASETLDESRRLVAEQQSRASREALERRTQSEQQLNQLLADLRLARAELEEVSRTLVGSRTAAELQSVGLFDYEHPAESSAALATSLEALRSRIKNAVRDKVAVSSTMNFTFNNSAAQGRKFVNDMTKVLLRAYNAEAENAVKATRAGNLHTAQARLSRAAEQIAKSGQMISLRITDSYHRMRLEELELAARHLQAVQAERELERERRAELREQRKAEQELQVERDRLEKERGHYLATLAALEANGDLDGAARIRSKLEDVDRAVADVDYRAANVRAGYVYVISNVGAFGERMVKIGMTRRLEPMDRVNELGDASVPFRFDVHALFFADDAVGIETMLHQHFAEQRVNRVNLRREFFYTTPEAVLAALKDHHVEIVSFAVEPEAPEYRTSLNMVEEAASVR